MSDISSLKKESLKGGLWNFMTTITNHLRNFVVSLILARLLSPEDFGILGMATAFSGLIDAFVDFGFGNAIIQKEKITNKQISTVFYINLFMGIVFTLIMFSASSLIAIFFNEPILDSIVKAMSISFIVKSLETVPRALFKKKLDFKTPFKIQMISVIISGVIGIILAFWGYGVWALALSQISGWVISTLLIWIYSNWFPILYFKLSEVRDLWNFGYKYSISMFIDSVFIKLDTIVIGKLFSANILGLFYRAQSLNRLVAQYSFNSFSGVLFPSLSKLQHNITMLSSAVMRLIQIVCFSTFMLSGLMYVCASEVIQILYGSKWVDSVDFFRILALFSLVNTLPNVLVTPLLSIGKSGLNLKIEIIKKIIFVLAIPLGIKIGGLYGYVYAVQIAGAIALLLNINALRCIELSFIQQVRSIAYYIIPFFISICLVTFCENLIETNSLAILLFYKVIIFMISYLGYHSILKSEGLKLAIDLLLLVKSRK